MNNNVGGFLNALGMAFMGKGKDDELQRQLAAQAEAAKLADFERLASMREKGYVSPDALKSDVGQAFASPMMQGVGSPIALPTNLGRALEGTKALATDTFKMPTSTGSLNLVRDPSQTPSGMRQMEKFADRQADENTWKMRTKAAADLEAAREKARVEADNLKSERENSESYNALVTMLPSLQNMPEAAEFVAAIKAGKQPGTNYGKMLDVAKTLSGQQTQIQAAREQANANRTAISGVTQLRGDDNKTDVVAYDKNGNKITLGEAPPKSMSENAQGMATKARTLAGISEMFNSHSNMDEYEKGLSEGRIKIRAGAQLLQRLANTFTHDDPASAVVQSAALAALNNVDPALARYIRRGLSFAEGEAMISGRPSDFRTKMAAFLSTAASGASPEMIADIHNRRQAIISPLITAFPDAIASQGQHQANPRAPSKVPSFEDWLKSKEKK